MFNSYVLRLYFTNMRVVEANELKKRKAARAKEHRKATRKSFIRVSLLVLVISVIAWFLLNHYLPNKVYSPTESSVRNQIAAEQNESEIPPEKARLVTFTGDQFKELYRSVNYPNIQFINEPPSITGNEKADKIIRELATQRGFVLTSLPVSPIKKTNETMLSGTEDDLLQPLAISSWMKLKKQAADDGIPLKLISAYRSIEKQRELFMSRLLDTGVTIEQIANGNGISQINLTLTLTAVPGYSRHHTGYTIDMFCDDGNAVFDGSSCHQWLKADNYEKAKRHGWIPSYPEDATEQGPEPEPWEYVWVGTAFLYE